MLLSVEIYSKKPGCKKGAALFKIASAVKSKGAAKKWLSGIG